MSGDDEQDSAEISPERRYLSIMFVDVVGFTRLSEEVDPEDLLTIQRRYRQIALAVTERFGGFVGDFAGDGVLAYFGYPTSRGNDAERAVRAALEITSQLERTEFMLADGRFRKLQSRIGVHTGLVVISRESVRAGETPLGVVGAAVNIAARLQHEAAPSCVVVSRETKSLIEDLFDFAPLGWRALKGLTQPIEAFQITRAKSVTLLSPAPSRSKTAAMIGREAALAQLLARWRSVCKNRASQLIEIVGDAGVGKTRLVEEFCSHPAANGASVIQLYCQELFANSPLHPVGNLLWRRAGLANEDDEETRGRKLGDLLDIWGLRTPANARILASLPSLGSALPPVASIAPTPHLFKRARFDLIATAFHNVAASRPTILLVDDAHWLDPSTAELMNETIALKRDEPYFVIVTRRSFPAGPPLPRPDETIRLEQLAEAHCLTLAMNLPGADTLPVEAVRAAARAAEGVPLFVEQLVRALLDDRARGVSRDRKGAALPLQLAQMMSERLDRLPGCRRIVQAAACLGRSFRPEFLASVLLEEPGALAEPLESLVRAEILLPKRHGVEIRYEFRHALIQRMADESMIERERRTIHARMVDILETESDVPASPEVLAYHQTRANLFGDAIVSWIEAGKRAAGQSAHHEAIDHLRQGLALLQRVPDETVRRGLELKVLAAMISSLTITQGATSHEVATHCARGLELSADFPTPMVFPFIFGQFTFANCRGRQVDAKTAAGMFLSLAEQMRFEVGRVIGHRLKGMLALGQGDLAAAKDELERSIALYAAERDAGATDTFGQNAYIHSQALLCQTLFCLGDVRKGLEVGREAMLALDQLHHPHTTAIALGYIAGNVFGYCDAPDPMVREMQRLLALCDEQDLPGFRPHALGFLGWGLAQKGEVAEGVARMEEAIAAFDAMEYTLCLGAHLANLADGLRRLGRFDEAKAASTRAIEVMATSGSEYWAEPEILRVDALIERELRQDNRKAAVDGLNRAIEAARRLNAPVFERRCLISLLEAADDPDVRREAQERLAALSHLDHLPELVEAVMTPASPAPAPPCDASAGAV